MDSELLIDLYRCASEPAGWTPFLNGLCERLGFKAAVVHGITFDGGAHARSFWRVHDRHSDLDAYNRLISDAGNPRLDVQRALLGTNRLVGDADLFRRAGEQRDRAHIEEREAALGMGNFIGTLVPVAPDTYYAIALHRDAGDRTTYSPRDRARVEGLVPHLVQAACIGHAAERREAWASLLERAVAAFPPAAWIVDGDGRVAWRNDRTAGLERAGHGLCILRGDRLHLGDGVSSVLPGCHRVGNGATALHVVVRRLGDGPHHLVAATEPGGMPGVSPASLRAYFGLTEAEACLAAALVAGSALETYAQARGVSIGTARNQLKQVLAKVGVPRQSELVRVVLTTAAALLAERLG
jgi:DNA-binding CsgD family transcriptional regulator